MAALRPAVRLVLCVAIGSAVAGCSGGGADRTGAADPALPHVHGLGVDPAGGTVYVATHRGLYRFSQQEPDPRQVGRPQDTMGFTVAGPSDFLASGHPPPDAGPMGPLGLLESRDGGRHWQQLSPPIDADFHALRAVGNAVYGWDASSGRLMTSADRRTWLTLSTLSLLDFAVNPDDDAEVVATTAQGLVRSADGGRTFIPEGSRFAYLSWPRGRELYAVTPEGGFATSADSGRTWRQLGTVPGHPEALDVNPSGFYAAVVGRGIYRSADQGRTFLLRYPYRD